jgi:hypothetical protein
MIIKWVEPAALTVLHSSLSTHWSSLTHSRTIKAGRSIGLWQSALQQQGLLSIKKGICMKLCLWMRFLQGPSIITRQRVMS